MLMLKLSLVVNNWLGATLNADAQAVLSCE